MGKVWDSKLCIIKAICGTRKSDVGSGFQMGATGRDAGPGGDDGDGATGGVFDAGEEEGIWRSDPYTFRRYSPPTA